MMDWTDSAGKAKYNQHLSPGSIGHVVPNAVPTPIESIDEHAIPCFRLHSAGAAVALRAMPILAMTTGAGQSASGGRLSSLESTGCVVSAVTWPKNIRRSMAGATMPGM